MKNALVAHHYLCEPGGAELVTIATAKALLEYGAGIELSSVFKYDSRNFNKWFGIELASIKESHILPFKINSFGIYVRLLMHHLLKKAFKAPQKFDLTWVDMPTYGKLHEEIKEKAGVFVEYIHFPLDAMLNEEMMKEGVLFGEKAYSDKRYGKFPMNYYFGTYLKLFKKYVRKNPYEYTDNVIANSAWTGKICERLYGKFPIILNPPISANVKINQSPPSFEKRKNKAVMVGRYTDEKRYHWLIEEVFPLVKKEVADATLCIIGSASTGRANDYINHLERLGKEKGFTVSRNNDAEADLQILSNVPREQINGIMDSSKTFIHATRNEHWGIAVAEAMANGLPAIVHKSGGAWTDLVMEGAYGRGYEEKEGAAEAIAYAFSNENSWRQMSKKSLERVNGLTVQEYSNKFQKMIRGMI